MCAAASQLAGHLRRADFRTLQDPVTWSLATCNATFRMGHSRECTGAPEVLESKPAARGHVFAVPLSWCLRQAPAAPRAPFLEDPCGGHLSLLAVSKPSPSLLFTLFPWGTQIGPQDNPYLPPDTPTPGFPKADLQ